MHNLTHRPREHFRRYLIESDKLQESSKTYRRPTTQLIAAVIIFFAKNAIVMSLLYYNIEDRLVREILHYNLSICQQTQPFYIQLSGAGHALQCFRPDTHLTDFYISKTLAGMRTKVSSQSHEWFKNAKDKQTKFIFIHVYINKNESPKCMYAHNFRTTAPNWIILFFWFVIVRTRFV